jgi:exosortase J
VLVLYYRIALGHPKLEDVAAQADYVIGSCLFLAATFLFIWVASRKERKAAPAQPGNDASANSPRIGDIWTKCAALMVIVLAALSLPSSALNFAHKDAPSLESLAARMPKQVGGFTLSRTWYEQQSGTPLVQAGAYSAPNSDEIVLGVWIAPLSYYHDTSKCWLARGLQPDTLTTQQFLVAGGKSVDLNTGFYSDGVTDSIVVDAACTPETCSQFQNVNSDKHLGFVFLQSHMGALAGTGQHPISIMVRIDRLHSDQPKPVTQGLLVGEARQFLAGVDPTGLSRSFQ